MKKIILSLIAILVLSVFSIAPLLPKGYFSMHDDTQIARVSEMKNSLLDGMFPVRWAENLGYGYGYPIFNFYAPFPYYIGGILNVAGFDAITATKLMFGIGILLSAVTMFYFLKKFFNPLTAIAGSLVYLYFPYHAVNIYVRGAVGEYFAYAFLPLVFLALYSLYENFKTEKKNSLMQILLLSVSIFFVTISHNLSAFMMFLMVSIFTGISLFSVKHKKYLLISIGLGFILGLGLSAFYFLPAVMESGYTNVTSQVGGGADYKNHFVCLGQYWNSMWGFGGSVSGCIDGLSFKLGKQNIILLLLTLILLLYGSLQKKKVKNIALINFVLLFVAVYFTLPLSKPIWDLLPFMPYLQYPWRFINFIGLFLTFSIGYLLYKTEIIFGKKVFYGSIGVVIFLTVFFNAKLFTPQFTSNNPESFYSNVRHINFDISKISDEYMPKQFAKPKKITELPVSLFESPNAAFSNISKTTNEISADYISTDKYTVHINIAYYPAWRVYINGNEEKLINDNRGMNFNLSKGEGNVLLSYHQTIPAIIGNSISIGSFLVLFVGIIKLRQKNKHGKQ